MKYHLLISACLLALLQPGLHAQESSPNLIANGDFQQVGSAPRTWNQLDRATGWSNANAGSVDLFSRTGGSRNTGIPTNALGSSEPFIGEHYAGFVAFKDDQRWNPKRFMDGRNEEPTRAAWNKYSEYLQIALNGPLTNGQDYEVSFRVKLAQESDRAVAGIGAMFTDVAKAERSNAHLTGMPDVHTSTAITDRAAWTEVKGVFKANGTERYVIFGAFPAAGLEPVKVIEGGDSQRAYYYIDGIGVRLKPEDDRDKDGIPDKDDKCPDEAGPASTQGCPDSDGDGVADKEDKCPTKPGKAEWNGCPDSDGDGIPDHLDKCPDVAGLAEMKGCPAIKEETRKLFEKALTGVKFETGSAKITKASFSILDDVVKVMEENPSYNLDIHGHTDNTGKAENNLQLSKDRAASVKTYLVSKGVDSGRLRSEGFGQEKPAYDNGTSEGRAKNRRVEFKVTFFD